jgi:Uma2 family endonuclease
MSENFESTYESSIPNQNFWENDGISLTGNPYYSPDSIVFTGSHLPGGLGEDHLSLNMPSTFNLKMSEDTNKNGFWKYNEEKILKQLEEYIASTYRQHYVDRTGGGKEQTLDKIKHNRREGFCAGNVTKYIDRYDTKGTPRADLFKVLHYTILLINHLNLIENK